MNRLLQDLQFAIRQLRKRPGFTLMAVLTLGLGIGAATAVFSLVDTILLRPLPFPEPDRIVSLQTMEQARGSAANSPAVIPNDTSAPNVRDWRDAQHSFTALAGWQPQTFTLGASNAPARRVDGMSVNADFFRVLGVTPALGRDFLRTEEQAGNRSVILSHALWQSAFNADPSAIGKTIQLSDETFTVIGVLPSGFAFPNLPDAQAFLTPALTMEGVHPSGQQRGWNQLEVIARLAPGVSIAQATADMQVIEQALSKRYPEEMARQTGVAITPQLKNLTGDVKGPLNILFAAVSFLLLIACANVAGLLLTRTAARRPELALRSAIGATRFQIVRQLLVESLTLSTLGGLLGFALAALTLRLAPTFLPADLPRLNELHLNLRVLLFSLAASGITGILFGVYPAWRSARTDPAAALRDTTRSSSASRGQNRLHAALVIAETALSLTLLIGAGLLIRSFNQLLTVDPGFDPAHLVTFRVGMPPKRFQDQRLLQLTQRLNERFATIPGVRAATYGYPLPLTNGDIKISFSIDGRPSSPGDQPSARVSLGAPNMFSTLKIPLRHGRFFSSTEELATNNTAIIINQAFADRYFPGQDAVGKRITSDLSMAEKSESREIVGIVGNVNRGSLTETPFPEYFIPFAQIPLGPPTFAIRVEGDPTSYEKTIRTLVAQIDPSLPVYGVRTNLLARSTAQQRFQTILISGFALLALILAAIGLYAVLSYMVAQRSLEMGIRMALGASRADNFRLILRRGLTLSIIGLAVGLAASALLTRYLATLLFHTPPLDLVTFLATTALLFFISLLACVLPSIKAARLEPMQALRAQ